MDRNFVYKCCLLEAAKRRQSGETPLLGFGNDCGKTGAPTSVLIWRYSKIIERWETQAERKSEKECWAIYEQAS